MDLGCGQSNASFDSCSRAWSIFIGMTLSTGNFQLSDENTPSLTFHTRDVKLQNILLTAKGVLKLGTPDTAP